MPDRDIVTGRLKRDDPVSRVVGRSHPGTSARSPFMARIAWRPGSAPRPSSVGAWPDRESDALAGGRENRQAVGVIGDRWGVTDAEIARRYPCDELVPAPALEVWRGVTVHASPAKVWLWLRQIQLAPYSYDWVDNLGRRSPQFLRDVADPVRGEHFTTASGRRCGQVLAVEPGRHLTVRILGAVMSYVLVPEGDATRLLLKVVTGGGRWVAPLLSVGDLVMARRQLLNLKRLAEQPAPVPRSSRAGRRSGPPNSPTVARCRLTVRSPRTGRPLRETDHRAPNWNGLSTC